MDCKLYLDFEFKELISQLHRVGQQTNAASGAVDAEIAFTLCMVETHPSSLMLAIAHISAAQLSHRKSSIINSH